MPSSLLRSTSFVLLNYVNYTAFAKCSGNILPHASWQAITWKSFNSLEMLIIKVKQIMHFYQNCSLLSAVLLRWWKRYLLSKLSEKVSLCKQLICSSHHSLASNDLKICTPVIQGPTSLILLQYFFPLRQGCQLSVHWINTSVIRKCYQFFIEIPQETQMPHSSFSYSLRKRCISTLVFRRLTQSTWSSLFIFISQIYWGKNEVIKNSLFLSLHFNI